MHRRMNAAALAVALLAAAPGAAHAKANATDRAFVREMVPHHQMATEMAAMARTDGTHAKIRALGGRIVTAQTAEIKTLRRLATSFGTSPAKMPEGGKMSTTMMRDLERLGVSEEHSGMTMGMDALHGATVFDRKFIDMMIGHHQGAIRMARGELARGTDARARKIARAVVAAQAKEIRQMNAWRKAWYGKASPAGGVPRP